MEAVDPKMKKTLLEEEANEIAKNAKKEDTQMAKRAKMEQQADKAQQKQKRL